MIALEQAQARQADQVGVRLRRRQLRGLRQRCQRHRYPCRRQRGQQPAADFHALDAALGLVSLVGCFRLPFLFSLAGRAGCLAPGHRHLV
ncbi:hypothetical protein D3C81_1308210 [compost metagenome]